MFSPLFGFAVAAQLDAAGVGACNGWGGGGHRGRMLAGLLAQASSPSLGIQPACRRSRHLLPANLALFSFRLVFGSDVRLRQSLPQLAFLGGVPLIGPILGRYLLHLPVRLPGRRARWHGGCSTALPG